MDVNKEKSKVKISKIAHQNHIVKETCDNGKLQYNCTACGKIFRSRSQQYYHLNCNQLQQMLYKCDQCNKSFMRHSQLKYHRQSHISPVNKCHKCQKTFTNPLALKKHVNLHKEKPKLCPHCDKSFLKKESLEQHISAQHLNHLQYHCANCSKKYSSKSSLQLHLQTHERKRHECSYCGKFFYRNSVLNLHLKRHYNSNGHTCAICHKEFSESGALIRHQKIHQGNVTQYFCKLCSKRILRKDNMNRHVNTIHPEEKFDNIVEIIKPTHSKTNDGIIENQKKSIKNMRLTIIENILIKQQNHTTQAETYIPESTKNGKPQQNDFIDSPVKNQINVITSVPVNETSIIEFNFSESRHQTEKCSTLQKSFMLTDELLHRNERQYNLENNDPAISKDEIQIQTDYPQKTQTISPVIRSIGNVNKHLLINNFTDNKTTTTTNNGMNSEYKHKKYCRNYNIDLYRKILGCDEENEDNQRQDNDNNNRVSSDVLCNNADNNELKTAPVHWRKSFKTNYETSAFNSG